MGTQVGPGEKPRGVKIVVGKQAVIKSTPRMGCLLLFSPLPWLVGSCAFFFFFFFLVGLGWVGLKAKMSS